MIAIINVINNHSFIERRFQILHKTEIFTFLSFFLPQKETEICSQDKNDRTAPSWCTSLLFRSPCLYWGDTGVSVNTKAKRSVAQTFQMASLIFIILRCVLYVFPPPILLVIICIFQVCFFCTNPTHPTFCKRED